MTSACEDWDAVGQACQPGAAQWTYAYDGAGNLTHLERWEQTGVQPVDYVYNGANQIQCVDADHSGACEGGELLYQYDAYGNLLFDGTTRHVYDAAMRLVSVCPSIDGAACSGEETTYQYTGDGDRLSQTVGTTTTTYVIDTATSLTMVLAETTGTETIRYLHGLDLVAQSDGASTEYFAYDGLGSVRQVLGGTSVVMAQTFDPYGNPFGYAGPSAAPTSFGFTGEQTDANGLVFLRARYYAPSMGRFLNTDPSRQERNPYQYGLGDPVNRVDPSGLYPSGAEETALNIIEYYRANLSDAEALGALFIHPELNQVRGFANHNAKDRLDFILDITDSLGGYLGQFAIDFGDTGFKCGFQDSWLYIENGWDPHNGRVTSNQVGHFLTAVRLGYDRSHTFMGSLQIALGPLSEGQSLLESYAETALKLAVGHELRPDAGNQGIVKTTFVTGDQYNAATIRDIQDFLDAVWSDGMGYIELRDKTLRELFFRGGFYNQQGIFQNYTSDYTQWQQGNSLSDLYLTMKGWRFGEAVRLGHDVNGTPLVTRRDASRWLNRELVQFTAY